MIPNRLGQIIVCGIVCLLVTGAYGQTAWYVDDDAPGDPGPRDPTVSDLLEDGTAAHPFDAIREGIDAADGGDEVLVLDGTYTGVGNKDLNFTGKPVTVRSVSGDPATCVIDCEGNGRGFCFDREEDAGSVVQDITIRNANSDAGSVYCKRASPTLVNCTIKDGLAPYGAGVYCDYDSSPTLTNCTIEDNMAGCGGGVGCSQHACPTLTHCTIRDNIAAYGAGLWCSQDSNPTLTDCTISGNAYSDFGAGVDCNDSNPTLTNCTITGNAADYGGGGLHCRNASPTLINCTISNNAGGYCGGGLCSRYDSSPTLTGCTITGNTSRNWGGGIYCGDATATLTDCRVGGSTAVYGGGVGCLSFSSPLLTNCVITGNTATCRGGGVLCYESSPTLTNCTIDGNTAADCGGGMCCEYDADPSLTNCTVTGNRARAGGGMACSEYSSPTLTNCILWADTPVEILVDSGSPSVTYCDVQGGWPGEGNIDADPLFVLGPGGCNYLSQTASGQAEQSPCLDAGSDTAANLGLNTLTTRTDEATDAGIVDTGYHYSVLGTGIVGGDLDFDGDLDLDDLETFVAVLLGTDADPCRDAKADMNGDGLANGTDVQPFVVALLGS
ncbi:MAG: right-handed parallel beta-helix repeat-containing protein [Phycisphaerae bacterium]|nr:right-handed parallel beta-helix repeat-containing protein [Phycisphaerae bacterium]